MFRLARTVLPLQKNVQLAVARRCCKAKEEGYRDLANVYKDEEFSRMRENPELQEVVAPPIAKSSADVPRSPLLRCRVEAR